MSDYPSLPFFQAGDGEYPIADFILALTNDILEFAVASVAERRNRILSSEDLLERVNAEKAMIVDRIFGNRAGGKCQGEQLFEATLRRGLEILEAGPSRD